MDDREVDDSEGEDDEVNGNEDGDGDANEDDSEEGKLTRTNQANIYVIIPKMDPELELVYSKIMQWFGVISRFNRIQLLIWLIFPFFCTSVSDEDEDDELDEEVVALDSVYKDYFDVSIKYNFIVYPMNFKLEN